jgi:hypothetical protein
MASARASEGRWHNGEALGLSDVTAKISGCNSTRPQHIRHDL